MLLSELVMRYYKVSLAISNHRPCRSLNFQPLIRFGSWHWPFFIKREASEWFYKNRYYIFRFCIEIFVIDSILIAVSLFGQFNFFKLAVL